MVILVFHYVVVTFSTLAMIFHPHHLSHCGVVFPNYYILNQNFRCQQQFNCDSKDEKELSSWLSNTMCCLNRSCLILVCLIPAVVYFSLVSTATYYFDPKYRLAYSGSIHSWSFFSSKVPINLIFFLGLLQRKSSGWQGLSPDWPCAPWQFSSWKRSKSGHLRKIIRWKLRLKVHPTIFLCRCLFCLH